MRISVLSILTALTLTTTAASAQFILPETTEATQLATTASHTEMAAGFRESFLAAADAENLAAGLRQVAAEKDKAAEEAAAAFAVADKQTAECEAGLKQQPNSEFWQNCFNNWVMKAHPLRRASDAATESAERIRDAAERHTASAMVSYAAHYAALEKMFAEVDALRAANAELLTQHDVAMQMVGQISQEYDALAYPAADHCDRNSGHRVCKDEAFKRAAARVADAAVFDVLFAEIDNLTRLFTPAE